MVLDPEAFGGEDFPPLVTPEEEAVIKKFYDDNPQLKHNTAWEKVEKENATAWEKGSDNFYPDEPWIQTYSGRRFTPTNPYVDAIVIQDISHALSMKCRFNGHPRRFYSVAQHSVLVSYICDSADAFWGLMHDAAEAYLVDFPAPLKHSGKFDEYIAIEDNMQRAICKRFGLPEVEPISVKKADKILLATEARDLLSPLHSDWRQPAEPLPFKIEAMSQQQSKDLFMKRFFELTGHGPSAYEHYLKYEYKY